LTSNLDASNSPYEVLEDARFTMYEEWGEEYAGEVLDVSIYITDKDRNEAATFRAEIR